MNSTSTRTASLTFAVAVALTLGSTAANADSPREWGYWDAATAAGPNDAGSDGFSNMTTSQDINTATNNNSGNSLNNEQNTTRFNRGSVVAENGNQAEAESSINYVAYNICSNCNSSSKKLSKSHAITAGKVNVNVVSPLESDNANLTVSGTFNGGTFELQDENAKLTTKTKKGGRLIETFIEGKNKENNAIFTSQLEKNRNGENVQPFFSGSVVGAADFLLGKPMSASQITSQLRLGQTYKFTGQSYYGSKVNMSVNFQKATWKGEWSGIKSLHNGFKANGSISGSSLTSNKVKGIGKKIAGFVKNGSVDATLVGVINGTNASKAGVIGRTVLNVKQVKGTKSVGDIFKAKAK